MRASAQLWRTVNESVCAVRASTQYGVCITRALKPLDAPVWHGPIGFGASRRLGLRAFAELVVVLWGQPTIGSRGHFGERLRVICGIKCLPAAMGITRLTRGGQNARSNHFQVRDVTPTAPVTISGRVRPCDTSPPDGSLRRVCVQRMSRMHMPVRCERSD